jgi:NADPH2:quinone reductase
MQLQLHRTRSHQKQPDSRRRPTHIPHTMEAAAIDHFGGPEALTLHVVRVPAIDSGEVLIALDTAGVGSWDEDMPSIRAGS